MRKSLRLHTRNDGLREQKRSHEHHFQHLPEDFGRELLHRSDMLKPGIIDQNINWQAPNRLKEVRIGNITGQSFGLQHCGSLPRAFGSHVVDENLCPRLRQSGGDSIPDPGTASRNKGRPAPQIH